MDENGQSWPEAMLTLAIIMLIFGTLLPLATLLNSSLVWKKQSMAAAETGYHAAIHFKEQNQSSGSRIHDGVEYWWDIRHQAVCIRYESVRGEKRTCTDL